VIRILRTLDELEGWRSASAEPPALVPTMGALHEGHLALIRRASGAPGPCVVSIFVNPTQFNDAADFESYPRDFDRDVEGAAGAGAEAIFAPEVEAMYPPGDPPPVPPLPLVATEPGLEDAFRPGHFAGVCQVVLRLFRLVRPGSAIFGEKDWQQLQVVRAMVREQGLPIRILAGPTIREVDGLALSSRNQHLQGRDRERAASLSRALREGGAAADPAEGEGIMRGVLGEAGVEPEYAAIRDARTLLAAREAGPEGLRALVAARVGRTRLIDNGPWPGGPV